MHEEEEKICPHKFDKAIFLLNNGVVRPIKPTVQSFYPQVVCFSVHGEEYWYPDGTSKSHSEFTFTAAALFVIAVSIPGERVLLLKLSFS